MAGKRRITRDFDDSIRDSRNRHVRPIDSVGRWRERLVVAVIAAWMIPSGHAFIPSDYQHSMRPRADDTALLYPLTSRRRSRPAVPFLTLASKLSPDDWSNSMPNSAATDSANTSHNTTLSPQDNSSSGGAANTRADAASSMVRSSKVPRKEMELMWCDANVCKDDLRERATEEGRIVMRGPATGQVAYHWMEVKDDTVEHSTGAPAPLRATKQQCVLFLVKQGSDMDALLSICADAVRELTATHGHNVRILLDPSTAARLQHYHGVTGQHVHLFEATPCRGFGNNVHPDDVAATEFGSSGSETADSVRSRWAPNLIVTIGGDGLLMHAGMLFQGPMPPILCVAGGSLGFLTPFSPAEMVPAIEVSLGLVAAEPSQKPNGLQVFPPNMLTYPYDDDMYDANELNSSTSIEIAGAIGSGDSPHRFKFPFGVGDVICLSIRMRLDCRIITRDGAVKARYNVLNEVVVDRGSSPYLAALECFCDDSHLTTVQADGVIFATPTGSTAYSLAAGSSVVHPSVPCILVTPICPHVLSFRSMVFPDHVVLRCYVPADARADASVAFDGKHRQMLHRGDSVQIQLSAYPVPTINRKDHSADWLGSLKRSFNFNSRPRQRPL